jgi:hypothetical protein
MAWRDIDDKETDEAVFGKGEYPKGMKIDLASGVIYSSPGTVQNGYVSGLTINQGAVGGIVLAAGPNFALDAWGNLKLRGNWEFWCDEKGLTGLRNNGVYSDKSDVTYKDEGGIRIP